MKFKSGDPVWVRSEGPPNDDPPKGEHAGVVLGEYDWPFGWPHTSYQVEVGESTPWVCAEPCLRPRRDDYQQHEPRVSREDLLHNIKQPLDLTEQSLEEILVTLYEELGIP